MYILYEIPPPPPPLEQDLNAILGVRFVRVGE